MRKSRLPGALCATLLLFVSISATAEAATFIVDPSLSNITISGGMALNNVQGDWKVTEDIPFIGSTILASGSVSVTGSSQLVQQGPGSLTTSLAGTINASKIGGGLTFNGGSITANNNGVWRPGLNNNASGADLAQLAGVMISTNVDARFTGGIVNIVLNILSPYIINTFSSNTYLAQRSSSIFISGSTPLNGSLFDMTPLMHAYTSGVIGIDAAGNQTLPFEEEKVLTGLTLAMGGGTGTYIDGTINQLILPFDWTITEQIPATFGWKDLGGGIEVRGTRGTIDITTNYTGQIVAFTQPVPIPAAVWLFGSGLIGLIGVARRKKA